MGIQPLVPPVRVLLKFLDYILHCISNAAIGGPWLVYILPWYNYQIEQAKIAQFGAGLAKNNVLSRLTPRSFRVTRVGLGSCPRNMMRIYVE